MSMFNSQDSRQNHRSIQGFGTARHQATVGFGREPLGQELLKGEGRLGHKARQSIEHRGTYLSGGGGGARTRMNQNPSVRTEAESDTR